MATPTTDATKPAAAKPPGAKPAAAKPKKTGTDLKRTEAAGLPADLAKQMAADSGKGVSTDQADNLVPLVYVLQTGSPQVNKRDDKYVDGAEAGMIWLKNAPVELISGEEGGLFQPCAFWKDWVEWKPQRVGYAGRHDIDKRPADVEERPDPQDPTRTILVRKSNGNIIQETRYHAGIWHIGDHRLGYVIPMTGSQHTDSKEWMALQNRTMLPNSSTKAPSFATLWRLQTKPKNNAKGDWFGWKASFDSFIQKVPEYEAGRALHEAFQSGAKAAEVPQEEEVAAGSGGGVSRETADKNI